MLKFHLMEDVSGNAASCAGAAVTAAGTWWSLIGDVAVQLLGVPLPVALAASTGAFLARTYQPAAALWRAFAGSACWVVGACALAPLAAPIAQKYAGVELPAGALAGVAFAIALAGPFALAHGIEYLRNRFGQTPPPAGPASSTPGATGAASDSKGTP
jgi:hypothetical protein